ADEPPVLRVGIGDYLAERPQVPARDFDGYPRSRRYPGGHRDVKGRRRAVVQRWPGVDWSAPATHGWAGGACGEPRRRGSRPTQTGSNGVALVVVTLDQGKAAPSVVVGSHSP